MRGVPRQCERCTAPWPPTETSQPVAACSICYQMVRYRTGVQHVYAAPRGAGRSVECGPDRQGPRTGARGIFLIPRSPRAEFPSTQVKVKVTGMSFRGGRVLGSRLKPSQHEPTLNTQQGNLSRCTRQGCARGKPNARFCIQSSTRWPTTVMVPSATRSGLCELELF